MSNSYNGFSWPERMAKFDEMKRRIASGELAPPSGPCRLCGDPSGPGTGVRFEYHDEDYGLVYSWSEPAAYAVCRDCHIYRIHQRTSRPESWFAFLAHVRRGGYARETREPAIRAELDQYRKDLRHGRTPKLRMLRPYVDAPGSEWFAKLSMNGPGTASRANGS